jgi:hypothetical protein
MKILSEHPEKWVSQLSVMPTHTTVANMDMPGTDLIFRTTLQVSAITSKLGSSLKFPQSARRTG